MDKDTELAQLDRDLKVAKRDADLGRALERLHNNRDFKEVVLKGFMESEAVRLVHLKADPAMQSPANQAAIVREIDAIGTLAEYFRTITLKSSRAAKVLEDGDETRERILQGDD